MNGDPAVMNLLRRIEGNPVIQGYLREISANACSIVQALAEYKTSKDPHAIDPNTYEHSLNELLILGTEQNQTPTHGANKACNDVASVLYFGNIRETCNILFQLFVNNYQRHNVLAQLMESCSLAPDTRKVGDTVVSAGCVFTTQRAPLAVPACMQFTYFHGLLQYAASYTGGGDTMQRTLAVLKIMIETFPDASRKESRVQRKPEDQHLYTLKFINIVPALSTREVAAQSEHSFPVRQDRRRTSGRCKWTTGHMAWQMKTKSTFVKEASKRKEYVIAGSSGHTYRLLGAMKTLYNFDLDKWILICVVWLVGSDHHSVYEVITAARFHGAHIPQGQSSMQFVELLLRRFETNLYPVQSAALASSPV